MDIICAKCGKHFSSVEAAREHRGNCRETSQGEQIHWVPAEKSKITPAEWGSLVNLINTQNPSPSETSPNVHPTTIQSENAKEPTHNRPTYSSRQCSGSQSNSEQSNSVKNPSRKRSNFRITTWLIALLFVFAFSLCGLGVSLFVGSFTPLWISLGFSVVFSIERWFRKTTARKAIGRVYRLLLNLGILSALSLLVWSGIQLFSGQTASKPIVDSMLLLAEFVLFVWLWKVVARNSWRWPSMKLTIFSLLCVAVVFAFAGVAPFSSYKDTLIAKWEDFQTERAIEQAKREVEAERKAEEKQIAKSLAETPIQPATVVREVPEPQVVAPKPVLKDPSWAQLKAFLLKDDTDKMKYIYPSFVCDDFANMLKKNAEAAGLRCAKVTINLSGYPDWYKLGIPSNTEHSCNAFETTDRGLVFVDCTRSMGIGPDNQDNTVDVKVGNQYIPVAVLPSIGWGSNSLSMGTITGFNLRW